jgi:hypothetical protein
MIKFIGLFWYPGSGGEFIQSLLLLEKQYIGFQEKFSLTPSGRVLENKKNIQIFNKKFFYPHHLYNRIWRNSDIPLLEKISKNYPNQTLIIPTHMIENINFLKKRLKNFYSLGITYKKNMYPIVLKNYCKKIVSDSSYKIKFKETYNKKIHQYFKNKNIFGEYFFKQELKSNNNFIKQEAKNCFDYHINLEDIYIKNFSSLKKLIKIDRSKKEKINNWLSLQSKIYQSYFPLNQELKEALGFNSKAKKKYYKNLPLDNYDNILLQRYIKANKNINMPQFKNLASALFFFKKIYK